MNRKCVLIFCTFVWNIFIPRRIKRDIIKIVYWYSCKAPVMLADCNETWIFWTRFSKNSQKSNFMKILPVGASCSLRTDGQTDRQTDGPTDMTKLIVALLNYANAPNNTHILLRKILSIFIAILRARATRLDSSSANHIVTAATHKKRHPVLALPFPWQ